MVFYWTYGYGCIQNVSLTKSKNEFSLNGEFFFENKLSYPQHAYNLGVHIGFVFWKVLYSVVGFDGVCWKLQPGTGGAGEATEGIKHKG